LIYLLHQSILMMSVQHCKALACVSVCVVGTASIHAILSPSCRGRQVLLYKRAQIFVADVWGAFGGTGLGAFHDLERLTTFADYRVPVVLRQLGVLRYADDLAHQVTRVCRVAVCIACHPIIECADYPKTFVMVLRQLRKLQPASASILQ
jgi:Potential Queuosine, Q, salvage protein family